MSLQETQFSGPPGQPSRKGRYADSPEEQRAAHPVRALSLGPLTPGADRLPDGHVELVIPCTAYPLHGAGGHGDSQADSPRLVRLGCRQSTCMRKATRGYDKRASGSIMAAVAPMRAFVPALGSEFSGYGEER